MTRLRSIAPALLAATLAACAADRPPDPPNFIPPAELLAELVGNTAKGSNGQTAGATFYESAERARFRTTILATGQVVSDTFTVSIQGDALCFRADTAWDRRTFCSRFFRTEDGYVSRPTDNRPPGVSRRLPGNPEGL